jgi:hypothetical protein
MENKAVFYVHFDIFIFENKEAGKKIQLDGQFARCPAAVECPEVDTMFIFLDYHLLLENEWHALNLNLNIYVTEEENKYV